MPRKLVLLIGLIVAAAAIATACSDSDDPTATPEASHDDHADHVGVLTALATLADADLHHVETTLIGDAPEIDPTWIAPILNARTAVALIEWPEELQEASENFLADSMPLLMALQDDDLDAATGAAPDAHASWHLLRDPGYAYLAEVAGTGSMGDDGHDHEDGDDMDMSDDDDMDMDDDDS